jgi:methyltransferase (TIGR00027 family)
VLLGAGLDTFGYRSPLAQELDVFEVDYPATQAWKRGRLAAAGIPVPDRVRFVPVDFGADPLSDHLVEGGFDRARPTFISWLGVSQYLSGEAIAATLDDISRFARDSELVMEYLVPVEMRDEAGQAVAEFFMPFAAAVGEPWLTFLIPSAVARLLAARAMMVIDDVGRKDQIDPMLWKRSDTLHPHELGRLVRAVVTT